MIDIEKENLRLLTRASADVPGRPHVSTLIRWSRRGVRGIQLESVMIGGRRYTSLEALQRFVARLSAQPSPEPPPSTRRQREIGDVERRLDDEGFT